MRAWFVILHSWQQLAFTLSQDQIHCPKINLQLASRHYDRHRLCLWMSSLSSVPCDIKAKKKPFTVNNSAVTALCFYLSSKM